MRPPYDLGRRQVALTCGYHDSCKRRGRSYPAGDGLDWNDNNGTVPETRAVYFTASAHASKIGHIAKVVVEFHPAGRDYGYPCHTVVANVVSVPENLLLFRVMYQHVVPAGPRVFAIVGSPGDHPVPNVIRRIGTMVDDPCPFFSKAADGRPLLHAHVEPSRIRAPFVGYAKNAHHDRHGVRVIPDVNGCHKEACSGPVYPGPRWRHPYWELWTFRWAWTVESRTGRVRR